MEFEMKDLTPRLVEEFESKKLGIPHGWYGTRVSGTFMTGPCASLDECLETIRLLPEADAKPGVVSQSDKLGADAAARPAAKSVYELYSQVSAGRIGYSPARQGTRR
jgi:hypothetical protein